MNFKNQTTTRTKLIATCGPTFETYEDMKKMIKAGVNVIRLNTSHGDFEEHGKRITNAKKIRKELGVPVSILLDTKGPEIRIHKFENKSVKVPAGKKLLIHSKKEILGNENEFSVSYTDLAKTVKPGQIIMADDGKLTLEVTKVNANGTVEVVAKNAHKLSNNKAVNIPGAVLTLPFLGKRDKDFIK